MSPVMRGGNVAANGIRQHYLRYGTSGPRIVVLPGITSPAITWGFVAERLAENFEVYVIDVRGRGLSSSGPDLDYGLDACAADLQAFIEALDLDRPFLLGHSMGARITVRAVARGLRRLSGVILADPPVSGPSRRPYPSNLRWYLDSLELARRGMSGEQMRAFCPTWTDDQLALRAEWLHTCYAPAIRKAYAGFHEDDFHSDLPHLDEIPTALVVAGKGGVIEVNDEAEFRAIVPDISIHHVRDAGHMIPWDDLEGFLAVVVDFIRATTPTKRRDKA